MEDFSILELQQNIYSSIEKYIGDILSLETWSAVRYNIMSNIIDLEMIGKILRYREVVNNNLKDFIIIIEGNNNILLSINVHNIKNKICIYFNEL